ncbi:hypothetical protein BMR02_11560 [Methylococcaceae bacterium HT1]|nr:hypothetical protein BMR02_11560 [Methylococcaceae bacterium HT1]TXL13045.1 hypothetical protein BMR04_14690 [Methylococcaceae bacterium HT3]TXL20163.1 hypothetical protein BMR03_14650 [Methylococcaceae bacterium HT2]
MEQIKIDNFIKEHPGSSFPNYIHLEDKICADISLSILKKLNLISTTDDLMLVNEVDKLGDICDVVISDAENFNLKNTLSSLGVNYSKNVYINWYRYDDIDKMKIDDLINYFDDIWYLGSDDIDIFDESLTWIVSITHFGQVNFLKI